jgi:cytochrome c-type biogenesis protein CcmE
LVSYEGILPDLFREGQGVVAQGVLGAGQVVQAREVLAKHDEKYIPPEVAETMKTTQNAVAKPSLQHKAAL